VWLTGLLAGLLGLGRRRRRRGLLLATMVLLAAGSAVAVPTITSTPASAGLGGQAWQYDEDGAPEATGVGVLDWSLVSGPPGMVVDNTTGAFFWIPAGAGTVDVTLRVSDSTGAADQSFQVAVTDIAAPQLLFNPPVDGYVVPVGEIHGLEDGSFNVPVSGAQPMVTWGVSAGQDLGLGNSGRTCVQVTASGLYMVLYPFAYVCEVTIGAANALGADTQTFTVNFVDVEGGLASGLDGSLIPDVTEGDAALTVHFDTTSSLIPSADDGWETQTILEFGDGQLTLPDEPVGVFEHIYFTPGTYVARLTLFGTRRGVDQFNVGTQSIVETTIVVTEDELRPPVATLTATPEVGESPLTVSFTTDTVFGDGQLVLYELDYGDGDRFTPAIQTTAWVDPATVHVYQQPAWYIARLTLVALVDLGGGEPTELRSVVEKDIVVTDRGLIPPLARAGAIPARGDAPLSVTLTAETGDLDGLVTAKHWVLPDGSLSDEELPQLQFDTPGEYIATLVVRDDDGLQSTGTARIEVTKDGVLPPRIVSLPGRAAVVGERYVYDEDGRPTAVGGGPYRWTLGKNVEGRLLNAPEGMSVNETTGEIAWTPADGQRGEVAVSLFVENVAGVALQDFIVRVDGLPGAAGAPGAVAVPSSCDCGASGAGAPSQALLFGGLWLVGAVVLRRRRR
jgi:MYXO-CTERM domain-containing protein